MDCLFIIDLDSPGTICCYLIVDPDGSELYTATPALIK
jgi:hypothetical protein